MINTPGLVHFTNSDVERAASYLNVATSEGTVDELGFGPVLDYFADQLFPWCTTLTTRASYFFSSVAIIKLAIDHTVNKNKFTTSSSGDINYDLGRLQQNYKDYIRKAETYLSLCLKEMKDSEGTFGVVKIREYKRSKTKMSDIGKRGILRSPARYPNAIYRGALKKLTAFDENVSNTTLILETIKNRGEEASLINTDWFTNVETSISDIRNLYSYFESKENKKKSYSEIVESEDFSKFIQKADFSGFKLSGAQKNFLKRKIRASERVKLVDNINWQKVKGKDLTIEEIHNLYNGDDESRTIIAEAMLIDGLTKPFREIYKEWAEKKSRKIKRLNKEFSSSKTLKEWQADLKLFRWDKHDQFSDVLEFLEDCQQCLIKSKGKVNNALLDVIEERVDLVVEQNRGKIPPHLRANEGSKSEREDLKEDIGSLRDSDFRLWNAFRVIKDLYI